jgi:hypothetical protein
MPCCKCRGNLSFAPGTVVYSCKDGFVCVECADKIEAEPTKVEQAVDRAWELNR